MTDPNQQANQFQQHQEQLLSQLEEAVYQQHLEAGRKQRDEMMDAYMARGIQRAANQFLEETQQLYQQRLEETSHRHARQIVEARANLPDLEDEPAGNLQLPDLESKVQEEQQSYASLKHRNSKELPEDVQSCLDD